MRHTHLSPAFASPPLHKAGAQAIATAYFQQMHSTTVLPMIICLPHRVSAATTASHLVQNTIADDPLLQQCLCFVCWLKQQQGMIAHTYHPWQDMCKGKAGWGCLTYGW